MRSTNMVIAVAMFAALPFAPLAAEEDAAPFTAVGLTEPGAKKLPPRDAGARYGEAAGAALVCYGLKITPHVAELRAGYDGTDLAELSLIHI